MYENLIKTLEDSITTLNSLSISVNPQNLIEVEYPDYDCTLEYQEGALVIKDEVLSQYWKYPKTGELVWLNVNNYEQYDLFLNI